MAYIPPESYRLPMPGFTEVPSSHIYIFFRIEIGYFTKMKSVGIESI